MVKREMFERECKQKEEEKGRRMVRPLETDGDEGKKRVKIGESREKRKNREQNKWRREIIQTEREEEYSGIEKRNEREYREEKNKNGEKWGERDREREASNDRKERKKTEEIMS